ncbi:leucine-rich repeat-containing protein 24 [Euwallacea fornicatus]|uniref:leucine-rich repeat-containing protein 24 n=1 Tax=Euwallacea fornicatus TaxID=995702 RepID=UPI00338F1A9C
MRFLALLGVVAVFAVSARSESCPSICTCKWKNGKRTVECMERGLIKIPESADPETQVLDLSVNNIQILPRETFYRSGLVNLQRLFLRSCRLGQIDDRAFKGVTNLIELDLSSNLLTAIPSHTFRDTPFLRELIISNNPIQKIDSGAFSNIPSLIKLDISNCEIKTVVPGAFKGIDGLESLKINDNYLTELRPNTVQNLSKLHGVELHNNPWFCDCRLREVKKWLKGHNIPYPIAPRCNGPERLMKKSFAEIHIDDLACKPDILPANRYIETAAGENATIVCRASAQPAPHIKWYWNGKLLVNNSFFSNHQKITILELSLGEHEKKGILVISNVQEVDAVEFFCAAENRAGSSETNFTLRVISRPLGITSLGNGQIAGLSAALAVLILLVLVIISVLLMRVRRSPYVETKTPRQLEVVTVVNGSALPNGKAAISPISAIQSTERKQPSDLNLCNPIQKPPRANDPPPSGFISPSSNSGNNPDLINDMRQQETSEVPPTAAEQYQDRPASGEYSRNVDSLYPSSLWDSDSYNIQRVGSNSGFSYDDKTPIIEGNCANQLDESSSYRNKALGYPPDYGLPLPMSEMASSATQVSLPASTKTLRVWQKGGVPVLPPVTALKRALSSSRNSPDEGYQEGCGTDV